MVLGSARAPYQYRPLTPYLAQMLRYFTPHRRVREAYYLVRALVTGATLMVFDRYLHTWFSRGAAVAGALCLAAIIPFTYLAVIQESDPINLLVFVGAFWALARRRDGLLLHYVVAMVNEVRLFLPFAPVIIPLSWWVLFPQARRNGPRHSAASSGAGL